MKARQSSTSRKIDRRSLIARRRRRAVLCFGRASRRRSRESLFDLARELCPADAGGVREGDRHPRQFRPLLLRRGTGAVARGKGNPQVDVLFGGPVETFTAGEEQGIFEAYAPPTAADLPKRFKSAKGMWTAIADDPLVFMTNTKFLQEHNLQPPASWDDLFIRPTRACCKWPMRAPRAPR